MSDKASHVYKHLNCSHQGLVVTPTCSAESFTILASAASSVQVKIKEALYIKWEFPRRGSRKNVADLLQSERHITISKMLNSIVTAQPQELKKGRLEKQCS